MTLERDADALRRDADRPAARGCAGATASTRGDRVRLDRMPEGKVTAVFFGFTHCSDVDQYAADFARS